jgi:endoglucanase Acf2
MLVALLGLRLCGVVKAGAGSYSDQVPAGVIDEDFYGTSYGTLREKFNTGLRVDAALKHKRPIPTNTWWSDYIFQTDNDNHGTNLWTYPHGIEGIGTGFALKTITGWKGDDRGCDPLTDNVDVILKEGFAQTAIVVTDWSDTGVVIEKRGSGGVAKVTLAQGVPFVWFELTGLAPIIRPVGEQTFYDASGAKVDAANIKGSFVASNGKAFIGVTIPEDATITVQGGSPVVNAKYIVFSFLPSVAEFATFNAVAKNKVTKGEFAYGYDPLKGEITTTFKLTTANLDGGAGGDTLLSFLPHHWRKGTLDKPFVANLVYKTMFGQSKVAKGVSFTITYAFTGLVPYLPAPEGLTGEQTTRLKALITRHVGDAGFDGNTYAKGLGEKTQIMLMAKELGIDGWEKLRDVMINQFKDWFTYETSEEKGRFFALYPEYGALIGFPAGFGSQGFNDLHFHNGYFSTGASRVMLLSPQFAADFGEMAKLVTRTYANWERFEDGDNVFEPHLRTFDPYTGHSYAGGTGDGGGNNQESTSEAIQSSYGLFTLGVALDDPKIWQLGAVCYFLECQAAAEYWFDSPSHENYPVEYKHKYVGILRSMNYATATYFDGDFGWALGIQCCPCDHFYYHFSEYAAGSQVSWDQMIQDRIGDGKVGNADAEAHVKQMGAYLGGYHLNFLQQVDAAKTAAMLDSLYSGGGEWEEHLNIAHNYYNCFALKSYGTPAAGYHTSIPTGVVYKNAAGALTYLLYNAKAQAVSVQVFKGADVIATVQVGAGEYVVKRA